MVNMPGTYLLLQSAQGLSMQTTISQCRSGSTAGCISEIALQVGRGIFRANATGTFLRGKRVAKNTPEAPFGPAVVRRSGNDVEVVHPLMRLVIHEDKSSANHIEYTMEPRRKLKGTTGMLGSRDSWPTPNSPCTECSSAKVCLCNNWRIGTKDTCRIGAGQDGKKPFQPCTPGSGSKPSATELQKESSEVAKIKASKKYSRKLRTCKRILRALVPRMSKTLWALLLTDAKDCAFDAAEGSPSSKGMLRKSFCEAVENKVDASSPDKRLCRTVFKCKRRGYLPVLLSGGKACQAQRQARKARRKAKKAARRKAKKAAKGGN
jgi:hypothetical protein